MNEMKKYNGKDICMIKFKKILKGKGKSFYRY